ncbi:hypothetical protein ACFVH9_17275 [Streptomyces hirsutus]|uniref:hypothetical protein n=1 Tax=Streptomyces hirsutus TaxID=35620 RepID=UPI00363770E6
MTALDDYFVGYGPTQVHNIEVHEKPDGSSVIETVTYKPIRVFEKCPDGSLVELFDEAKDNALTAFWADMERLSNGEN